MLSSAIRKKRFFLITAVLLIAAVVIGRLVSYFVSVTSTDIAFDAWVPSLLGWLGEIITAARCAAGITAVAAAVYYADRSAVSSAVCISAAAAFLDYAARFFIDLLSSALTGMEALAAVWLLLQFLYEMIFIVLALLIGLGMKRKFHRAETEKSRSKFSCSRAAGVSVALVTLSRIVLELIYLIDFLVSYSNITNTEVASMVGQFLKIIVIYGGIALLVSDALHTIFASILSPEEEQDA